MKTIFVANIFVVLIKLASFRRKMQKYLFLDKNGYSSL